MSCPFRLARRARGKGIAACMVRHSCFFRRRRPVRAGASALYDKCVALLRYIRRYSGSHNHSAAADSAIRGRGDVIRVVVSENKPRQSDRLRC
jgi:hypothetical protein